MHASCEHGLVAEVEEIPASEIIIADERLLASEVHSRSVIDAAIFA